MYLSNNSKKNDIMEGIMKEQRHQEQHVDPHRHVSGHATKGTRILVLSGHDYKQQQQQQQQQQQLNHITTRTAGDTSLFFTKHETQSITWLHSFVPLSQQHGMLLMEL
jgi:hypothetical protein